jgi:hypothetical protein
MSLVPDSNADSCAMFLYKRKVGAMVHRLNNYALDIVN